MTKLYVVTREDIPTGAQAVQACHAAIEFNQTFPDISRQWFETSNYLVMLAVRNEEYLQRLIFRAKDLGIKHTEFREPDMDNQITAVAFEPTEKSKRLCRDIKLAFT